MSRPIGVTVLVVLADISALLFFLGACMMVWLATAAPVVYREEGPVLELILVLRVFGGIVVNLSIPVVGHYVWNGLNWARITLMVLLGLSCLDSAFSLGLDWVVQSSFGNSSVLAVITIAMYGLFIFILNGRAAREYCTR